MKKLACALAIAVAAALAGPAAAPARAGDVNVGITLGWSGGYGYAKRHHNRYFKHHRPYLLKKRHHRGHHKRKYYRHRYPGGHVARHRYRSRGYRPCRPVYKHSHWHGRPAKVGGTMCYNGRGHGYVVRGSRYLIHFY